MKTVTFSTVIAPFLATRTVLQLSRDEEKNFPLAAPALKKNFYMDDVLCGAASLMEAKTLKNQLSGILNSSGGSPSLGGEPKSVKRLRSGDLLVETNSALQTKSFLLAKSFLNSPDTINPHKSLNSCHGIISETNLLGKSSRVFPVRVLFSPIQPTNVKAGYLNCRIRPYIPNPLHCFKCQRFGHSQTSCRGQLTCSRCASVRHTSTDCSLEPKYVNCLQPHPSDSKICPKWKIEKQIQEIKTTKNISYPEARKLIVPQLSQTYAQAAKSSTLNNSTQTDENITKIKCPHLYI
ncbi:uncharacterized protein TNCV_4124241 [Trichonephila clavipes]|nr:uncharacterized protein TNCV_4124241 [Trichonephila clavipes]